MKDCEAIREQTNLSYQILEIQNKLNGIITDPERWRLTQEYRLKKSRLKKAQKEVYDKFNNII